jgi:hypothetical protein
MHIVGSNDSNVISRALIPTSFAVSPSNFAHDSTRFLLGTKDKPDDDSSPQRDKAHRSSSLEIRQMNHHHMILVFYRSDPNITI